MFVFYLCLPRAHVNEVIIDLARYAWEIPEVSGISGVSGAVVMMVSVGQVESLLAA